MDPIPQNNLVAMSHMEIPLSMFNMWCVNGPDGSVLFESAGYFYLCSPPYWTAEPIELELPISLGDFGPPALHAVYNDETDCLIALVGNGLFRIPWGVLEADTILLLDQQFSNRSHPTDLLFLQDRGYLMAGVGRKLFLIEAASMTLLDTLDLSALVIQMILDNTESSAYLRYYYSDSIAVIGIEATDRLILKRTLHAGVKLDRIGFIGEDLLGETRGSLFAIDTLIGTTTSLWEPPANSGFHDYQWIMAYPWGPYAFRVNWVTDLLEIVDITDLTVLQSFQFHLNRCCSLFIFFNTPQEGFICHFAAGSIYSITQSL